MKPKKVNLILYTMVNISSTVDEWVKVVASKSGQEGTLIVNDEEPVKGEITLSVDL
jgi:hypothetical protein